MYRTEYDPISSCAETARRVKAARAYAGISATQLADRIGLGRQTIKRIESARRTVRPFEVSAIAEVCGLPREFFEMDVDLLSRQETVLRESLARVEERLARIERKMSQPGFDGFGSQIPAHAAAAD